MNNKKKYLVGVMLTREQWQYIKALTTSEVTLSAVVRTIIQKEIDKNNEK